MDEMIGRMKSGVGSLENEKYRIMWRGNFPWFKIGFLSKLFSKYDAILVSGAYGMYGLQENTGSRLIEPDGYDLDDPLRTYACNTCVTNYTASFEYKWRSEFKQFIDGFSIDAVIIQAPHTCRPWTLTTREFARRVEAEYGIPAIVLEADHTDPAYFNDAQVEIRIKALPGDSGRAPGTADRAHTKRGVEEVIRYIVKRLLFMIPVLIGVSPAGLYDHVLYARGSGDHNSGPERHAGAGRTDQA